MTAQTGLFNLVGLGDEANVIASVVVMDLVFYGVHRANHAVPVLWRFHRAHHSDLDLDVTTAFRFHPGEVLISALIKLPAIWALGVSPLGLVSFEIGLLAAAQFQHSNLRVPEPYETIVRRVLVTPNMHRIHHSTVRGEHNSNFSTILSVWDRLLGTYRMNVHQEDIRIGLLEYQDPRAVSLTRVVWMPFVGRCSRTCSRSFCMMRRTQRNGLGMVCVLRKRLWIAGFRSACFYSRMRSMSREKGIARRRGVRILKTCWSGYSARVQP